MGENQFDILRSISQKFRQANLSQSKRDAFIGLWKDVWHKIGREFPTNRMPGKKFTNEVFHCDSYSIASICKIADEVGISYVERPGREEIELIAPGAEDFSLIVSKYHYKYRFNYYELEGMSMTEAIRVLNKCLIYENDSYDCIVLRFSTPSQLTGLRNKVLIYSPESKEFREFMQGAKSRLERTAEVLQMTVEPVSCPVKPDSFEAHNGVMHDKRYVLMRKRYAFLKKIVTEYDSQDNFLSDRKLWCSIIGINPVKSDKYIGLTIWLDQGEYETYYIIPSKDKHLTISEVVERQDDCCANSFLNIFTGKSAEEGEILTSN